LLSITEYLTDCLYRDKKIIADSEIHDWIKEIENSSPL
jgi:hypothetical protein